VEINPRYVASAEVLEQAMDIPLLDWHRRSCETFLAPSNALLDGEVEMALQSIAGQRQKICGKAILYALADLIWPDANDLRSQLRSEGSQLADIPQPGTTIPHSRPICTVLSSGNSENRCLVRLGRAIRRVRQFTASIGCS
jgi:predicted ATP-grasp superfamily ATP-dependent carboligase